MDKFRFYLTLFFEVRKRGELALDGEIFTDPMNLPSNLCFFFVF